MVRRIEVVQYNPNWLNQFRVEADKIAGVLRPEVIAIHHIGSTAIPNISAKPIIDILVEVRVIEKIDEFNEKMAELDYQSKGELGIPGRRFFIKNEDSTRTYHVHIFQTKALEVDQHLNFRDYLVAHPEETQDYSRLKEKLAREFPEDRESYIEGKEGFIKEILQNAKAWRERST